MSKQLAAQAVARLLASVLLATAGSFLGLGCADESATETDRTSRTPPADDDSATLRDAGSGDTSSGPAPTVSHVVELDASTPAQPADQADAGDTTGTSSPSAAADAADAPSPQAPDGAPSTPTPACTLGSYDADGDPNTPCQPHSSCAPGQYVQNEGTETSDRVCTSCEAGTYSGESNASECRAWTSCGWTELETRAPSNSVDRSCGPGSEYRWFGESGYDSATSVTTDPDGNVLVGANPGAVTKYDPNGSTLWSKEVNIAGSPQHSEDSFVAVDSQGNVLVSTGVNVIDAPFVSKYDPDGNLLWSQQLTDDDAPPLRLSFVTVDNQDNVLAAGSHANQAFVSKYDPDGNLLWTDGFEGPVSFARAIAADSEDNVLIAGDTNDKLPGIAEDVPGYLFVRKYAPDGTQLWTQQFGNETGFEETTALVVDGADNILVAAYTNAASDGSAEALVRKFDPAGNELWTVLFECNTAAPGARALAADGEQNVFVAGNAVSLGAPAEVSVRKFDPEGNELWTQFEAALEPSTFHTAEAVTVDATGRVFVAGTARYEQAGAVETRGFVWLVPEP